jgi:hypothetical protein
MAPPRHSAQTGTELDGLHTISLRYPLLSAAPESAFGVPLHFPGE